MRQPGGSSGYVTEKSRTTAAILAFLLGGFGAPQVLPGPDRDGDRLPAVLLTFVPAIVGFIEFIILLAISDDAFARKYGRPVTA